MHRLVETKPTKYGERIVYITAGGSACTTKNTNALNTYIQSEISHYFTEYSFRIIGAIPSEKGVINEEERG